MSLFCKEQLDAGVVSAVNPHFASSPSVVLTNSLKQKPALGIQIISSRSLGTCRGA